MLLRKFVYNASLWVVISPLLPLYVVHVAAQAVADAADWLMRTGPIQRYYEIFARVDSWLLSKLGKPRD